ncbi:MAG: hypothetical protein ABIQ31_00395 [Ferruginibacter sp.]
MKYLLIILIIFGFTNCYSQFASIGQYKDSINGFAINIPVGWRYGVNKSYPDLQLLAYRSPVDTSDQPHENFNINIFKKENSSLNREYEKFINAQKSTNDFNLKEADSIVIHGQLFKWIIETHKNEVNAEPMNNYVFLTYKSGKTYILTFAAYSKSFQKYRQLFYQIANTLIL